jgi:ATP-dependent Clp protease ATP-binding subunit ClpA
MILQIHNEGAITDSQGRKVVFKVCTIICLTNNIGTSLFV